jgi:hypothetical protein
MGPSVGHHVPGEGRGPAAADRVGQPIGGDVQDALVLPGVGGARQVLVHPRGPHRQPPAAQALRRRHRLGDLGGQAHGQYLLRLGVTAQPGGGQSPRQRLGVSTTPSGTGNPARFRSPKVAALPPTRPASASPTASKTSPSPLLGSIISTTFQP